MSQNADIGEESELGFLLAEGHVTAWQTHGIYWDIALLGRTSNRSLLLEVRPNIDIYQLHGY